MRNRFLQTFRMPLVAVRAALAGMALLMAGAGVASAAEIILYDGRNFEGQSVSLTQSTPDLGNFDNEASSVRVISGIWVLYRNDNYGETPSRPSVSLGPGDYPNLSDVGFPRNKLSSVALAVDGAPPPPQPQACTDNNSVTTAAGGCRGCAPGSVASPDNNRCVCGPGRQVLGRRGNGDDRCGPFAGQPDPATQQQQQQPTCPGRNQIAFGGRCLNCPENTMPNASASRCVCAPGMINRGVDNQGQELCIRPSGPANQSGSGGGGGNTAGTRTVEVPAGDVWYVAHNQFRFGNFITHAGSGLSYCQVYDGRGGERGKIALDSLGDEGNDLLCEAVIFQGNIDPAWTMSFSTPRHVDGICASSSVTRLSPGDNRGPGFLIRFTSSPGGSGCRMNIDTITMTGPASGKWEEAFD